MSEFWKRRQEHKGMLSHFLAGQQPLVVLSESRGNLGDGLIREGMHHLLDDAGIAFEVVADDLSIADSVSKTLLLRGGGGYDQLFHAYFPALVLRAAPLFRRVVILPASFDPQEGIVKQCLEEPNVFAMAREMQSFRALAPFGRRLAALDCAVYHRRFTPQAAASTAGTGTLLVLRGDQGSPLVSKSLQPNPVLNDDIGLTARNVDDWLGRIDAVRTIITDRMHVAVAAILLGKKVVMVNPYDNKMPSYRAFTFRDSFAERIEERTVEWLASEGLAVPVSQ
jgi:exopolysaccharide biosynthesis predicted pyruvyltransferase EpsI